MRIDRSSPKAPARVLVALAEDTALSAVRWLLADADRRVIQRGRLDAHGGEPPPLAADRTVLIAPGQAAVTRRLEITAARPAQARAAALYQLGEQLAAQADSLHAAVGAPGLDGLRWVSAVDTATLEAWRAQAARLGLGAGVIAPDSLLPEPPAEDGDWSAVVLGDRVALRAADRALTVEPDLAQALVGDTPVAVTEDAAGLEARMIALAFDPPLNLLDGLGREGEAGGLRPWRRAAVLAGALLASPLVLTAADAIRHDVLAGTLERRSAVEARRAWPDLPAGAAPIDEARRRLGPGGGFTPAVAALFAALEGLEGVSLQTLLVDDAGALRASLAHPDYADMRTLDAALEPYGLGVTEDSTSQEDGRVISDVVVAAR